MFSQIFRKIRVFKLSRRWTGSELFSQFLNTRKMTLVMFEFLNQSEKKKTFFQMERTVLSLKNHIKSTMLWDLNQSSCVQSLRYKSEILTKNCISFIQLNNSSKMTRWYFDSKVVLYKPKYFYGIYRTKTFDLKNFFAVQCVI